MYLRSICLIAVLGVAPRVAGAQFTTFIPPQNKVADSVKAAVVAEQKAQADSVAAKQITNMKTWVDSAAGIAGPPVTTADSLAAGLPAPANGADTATFRNGIPAPETASDLPLIALLGTALLALGIVMIAMDEAKPREAVLAEREAARAQRASGGRA